MIYEGLGTKYKDIYENRKLTAEEKFSLNLWKYLYGELEKSIINTEIGLWRAKYEFDKQ
jgi:hypothetical protein